MAERRRTARRAALGGVAACALLLASPASAATSEEDCGGGSIRLVQDEAPDVSTITAARISGIDEACDGQAVGVMFLGNEQGDPALPATELARSYSDEDPCTGADLSSGGVLEDGAVEVPLCEGSETAGFVDGRQLTRMRLLTTTEAAPVRGEGTPDAAPDPVTPQPAPEGPSPTIGAPDPVAPQPAPEPTPDGPLPTTGADAMLAAALGALAMLLGSAMVRSVRGICR